MPEVLGDNKANKAENKAEIMRGESVLYFNKTMPVLMYLIEQSFSCYDNFV